MPKKSFHCAIAEVSIAFQMQEMSKAKISLVVQQDIEILFPIGCLYWIGTTQIHVNEFCNLQWLIAMVRIGLLPMMHVMQCSWTNGPSK